MPTTPECDYDIVSSEGLLSLLRDENTNTVILDCRSSNEYGESHIRNAVNFSIPSIMLRRLAAGKIELASTIKCRELKNKICSTYTENLFILYNDLSGVQQYPGESVLSVLLRRLTQDGCRVVCLKDGFPRFRASFPEWCESCTELLDTTSAVPTAAGQEALPLMGLRSLRISAPPLQRPHRSCDSLSSTANSSTDSSDTDDRCDSSLGLLDDDKDFPVMILPHLYLGNAANSEDSQALSKHSIQYILNVTPDLPNVFEDAESIKYMKIPITDHWSQNLASHFPKAFAFIDEARAREKGVLVHCLAGVSRSVTITVAYLMYKCHLNLNDAFNLVRARKSNIAPNFNFMEQLHSFEKELKLDQSSQSPIELMAQMEQIRQEQKDRTNRSEGGSRSSRSKECKNCSLKTEDCKCKQHSDFLSPLAHIGVSPDSGIEFDRWASGTPGE